MTDTSYITPDPAGLAKALKYKAPLKMLSNDTHIRDFKKGYKYGNTKNSLSTGAGSDGCSPVGVPQYAVRDHHHADHDMT